MARRNTTKKPKPRRTQKGRNLQGRREEDPPGVDDKTLTIDRVDVDHSPMTGRDGPETQLTEGFRLVKPNACLISSPVNFRKAQHRLPHAEDTSDAVKRLWDDFTEPVTGNEIDKTKSDIQEMQKSEGFAYLARRT
jgi:hypothetical protein